MNPTTHAAAMRRIHIAAICAAGALIIAFVALNVLTGGWGSLVAHSGSVGFGMCFWLAAGTVAGLILGKMDAVVAIANTQRHFTDGLSNFIIEISCTRLRDGRVLQNNIANLLSAAAGVAIVYGVCQLIALAGIAAFAEFPQGILWLLPFVTAWKVVENVSRDAFVRHYNRRCAA